MFRIPVSYVHFAGSIGVPNTPLNSSDQTGDPQFCPHAPGALVSNTMLSTSRLTAHPEPLAPRCLMGIPRHISARSFFGGAHHTPVARFHRFLALSSRNLLRQARFALSAYSTAERTSGAPCFSAASDIACGQDQDCHVVIWHGPSIVPWNGHF